jgi:hypothetical protein
MEDIQRTMARMKGLDKLFHEGGIEPRQYGELMYHHRAVLAELERDLYAESWEDTSWDYED